MTSGARNAHSTPYNPSSRSIGAFAGFGIALIVLNRFPWFQARVWFGAAIFFFAIAFLLWLRRTIWKRVLIVTDDCLVVPVGFLRLRPTTVLFENIREAWVTKIAFTLVLRIRTTEGDIEIQDIYLADRTVLWELKRILETSAPLPEPPSATRK